MIEELLERPSTRVIFWLIILTVVIAYWPTSEVVYAEPTIHIVTVYEEVEVVIFEEVEVMVEPDYYYVWAKVTMYAPGDNRSGICADENPDVTSTGRTPGRDFAAVDPRKIPYGTKMYVEGYGYVEAQDTGGALRSYRGYHIDLYADTYEEAMRHGVQYKKVRIYMEEDNDEER